GEGGGGGRGEGFLQSQRRSVELRRLGGVSRDEAGASGQQHNPTSQSLGLPILILPASAFFPTRPLSLMISHAARVPSPDPFCRPPSFPTTARAATWAWGTVSACKDYIYFKLPKSRVTASPIAPESIRLKAVALSLGNGRAATGDQTDVALGPDRCNHPTEGPN
ncbi:hypothetical protein CRG98_038558, partial [Punica granatum]